MGPKFKHVGSSETGLPGVSKVPQRVPRVASLRVSLVPPGLVLHITEVPCARMGDFNTCVCVMGQILAGKKKPPKTGILRDIILGDIFVVLAGYSRHCLRTKLY